MPKHSVWRVMQFDTLRLGLIEFAARVVELKTHVKIPPAVQVSRAPACSELTVELGIEGSIESPSGGETVASLTSSIRLPWPELGPENETVG